jgi:hypothetical protein
MGHLVPSHRSHEVLPVSISKSKQTCKESDKLKWGKTCCEELGSVRDPARAVRPRSWRSDHHSTTSPAHRPLGLCVEKKAGELAGSVYHPNFYKAIKL